MVEDNRSVSSRSVAYDDALHAVARKERAKRLARGAVLGFPLKARVHSGPSPPPCRRETVQRLDFSGRGPTPCQ